MSLWGTKTWMSNAINGTDSPDFSSSRNGPILSNGYPSGNVGGTAVSIAPLGAAVSSRWPFDQGQSVTVVGALISVVPVRGPGISEVEWIVEIGSGHGGDGPDVFARAVGKGCQSKMFEVPAPGFPQGGTNAHFDVYAACNGTDQSWMRIYVNIYYTSA